MGKRDGRQKGPQQHAEGQHGELTHARFLEQLQESGVGESDAAAPPSGAANESTHRRLEKHLPNPDDVDENSGRNRQRR